MSAFVVSEDHVKQLALAWGRWTCDRHDHEEIVEVARELMRENIRSVETRYPGSDGELPGPIPTPEADAIDIGIMERVRITPVMALKMADCLEYQSCETGWDNWKQTKAAELLDQIRRRATSKLPGYEDAPWDYAGGAA